MCPGEGYPVDISTLPIDPDPSYSLRLNYAAR
jgi:hypothetical protein